VLKALELELQAARYVAERAATQYEASDPKNRLVADELERRWNTALERVAQLEERIRQKRSQRPVADMASKEVLVSLAQELEKLWDHPQTDVRLKKRLMRTLLEEVIVEVCPKAGEIQLVLHWQGGVHSELTVPRRRRGQNRLHTAAPIVEAVQILSRISADDKIAGWLNQHQLRTGKGNYWTQAGVASLRSKRGLPAYSNEHRQREGWMNLGQAAAFLGISSTTLRLAAEAHRIPALHPLPGGPWVFKREDLQTPSAQELVKRVQTRRQDSEPDPQQLPLSYSTK